MRLAVTAALGCLLLAGAPIAAAEPVNPPEVPPDPSRTVFVDNPAIVLVQGSFQLPEVYYKLADALRTSGYEVHQPSLPTLTEPDLATKTLSDDAAAVRSEVKALVDGGKAVVVVMHSYGGLVGSEAVLKDLSFSQRQSEGLPGGVGKYCHGSSICSN